ncbi:exo-alpha-sialidase [Candidatus Peregrinibacteria bacterium]|nr:MAG: exo-alpha-sialidase [Candidatus Peregrinibacteria bacterium]
MTPFFPSHHPTLNPKTLIIGASLLGSLGVLAVFVEPNAEPNLDSTVEDVAGSPELLSLGFNNAEQIVTDEGSNGIHMAWVADQQLFFVSRNEEGVLTAKSMAEGNILLPALAQSKNQVGLAWVEKIDGENFVHVRISQDSGENFGEAKILGSGSGVSLRASGEQMSLAWHENASPLSSKIMLSVWAEKEWSEPIRVDASTQAPLWPSVAMDGSELYVTWRDNRNGYYSIWLRRSLDGGKTWEEEQNISKAISGDPDICLGAENTVWLAHHGKGNITLRQSTDGGVHFNHEESLGSGHFAHLSCNKETAAIVWEDGEAVAWAFYKNEFKKIDAGQIHDGKTAAGTAYLSPKNDFLEIFWIKITGSTPLLGNLRHQKIFFNTSQTLKKDLS